MRKLLWLPVCLSLAATAPFASANVYNVTNSADAVGAVFSLGGGSYNASSLRAAVNAANAAVGPHTINIPSGTYLLTLGELPVGTNGNLTVTLNGTGTTANTIVQHNTSAAAARIFDIDTLLAGGVNVTIQNLTIAHGRNSDGIGGAGVICGFQGPPTADTTVISNCVFLDNLVINNLPTAVGGGIQNIGGNLKVFNTLFDSNSSSNFSGGAIYYDSHSPSTGICQIANCIFTNNSSADPSSGGGAIFVSGVTNSLLTISNSLFTGNRVTSSSGSGGAIIKFGTAPLIVSGCTFTNNRVLGTSATVDNASGGAIDVGGGPMTIIYSRFATNTAAAAGHGNSVNGASASGATLISDNNWWGVTGSPTGADLSGTNVTTWLKLTHYATPQTINPGSSTLLTASVITNSAGAQIPLANLGVLLGLPITFSNAVGGSLSAPQSVIQPSGTATATFTISTGPVHTADAVVDNEKATATITLVCPTITATASGGGSICPGGSANITVTVSGGVSPYVVSLNNGSLPKTNASPVVFAVSPATTTTYSAITATDISGCPATVTGSPTITVNTATSTITPNPSSVCPNVAGNQANGPAGMTGYAWTISNGTITSSAHSQNISYTSGASGTVTLGLTVTNASGCTGINSVGVPIGAPLTPGITPTPASVNASSPGNQATATAGFTGYAWTISNGTITSSATGSSISYVAGLSGNVVLGLTVMNASGCSGSTSVNVPIIPGANSALGSSFRTNYFASLTFSNGLVGVSMPVAFDGTNYWSCTGGNPVGVRYARYDSNGVVNATYSPGLDFRSIFADGSGLILARAYNDPNIYRQSAPGVFAPSGVVLTGGAIDPQASVVLNGAGTEYVAMSSGIISRWDPAGNFIGNVTLQGYGTVSGENNNPQNVECAAFGDFWLTYNGAGLLSVWDAAGNRVTRVTLAGAGISPDYSFSYANGKAFVVDSSVGTWRGYDVGSPGRVAIYGAPSVTAWNTDVQSKIFGTGQLPQVDAAFVSGTNLTPAIAELRRYESVLVYSDASFNNGTNLGNVLADYVDLGAGVVMNTFAYETNAGLSIQGRLVTGNYLPLTSSNQTSGANLMLVKDQPTHPIYTAVAGFNGGTTSFHNAAITTTAGATLLGHWSDNQPLVAIKDVGAGRTAGLNFYPPSSDARSDFWTATTDGGRLMANALLYAGKVPPVITMTASNSVQGVGSNVTFTASAAGLPPFTYQWRKNGTNIAGATTNTLSFTVVANSGGFYTVAVSNAYGMALSSSAALNLPLRILSPALRVGGALPLFVGTGDGSPLTVYRASRIRIYASASASAPMNTWTLLNNPQVLTNGLLRVDGIQAANATTFFRAAETP